MRLGVAKSHDYTERPISAERPRLPYPNGWFAVAFSEDVPPGKVLRRRFMGEDVVIYRTRSGLPRVIDPYCPHLGAHLGYGGSVAGEEIVCPFHHFRFDSSGACTATGYGTKPPNARLAVKRAVEVNGVIMVWRHASDGLPTWEVPEKAVSGFPSPARHMYTIIDHPQEVVENAIDIGHVGPIHHYKNPRVRKPMELDGPKFMIGPAAERVFPVIGAVDIVFDVEAYGLGYIWVNAKIPRLRAQALFQAMATPVDPCRIDLRFTVSLKVGRPGRGPSKAMSGLSRGLTIGLAQAFWHDLSLDFPIWENKRFLDRPRLAKGDGPVMNFRKWAKQFYCDEHSDGSTNGVGDGTSRSGATLEALSSSSDSRYR